MHKCQTKPSANRYAIYKVKALRNMVYGEIHTNIKEEFLSFAKKNLIRYNNVHRGVKRLTTYLKEAMQGVLCH